MKQLFITASLSNQKTLGALVGKLLHFFVENLFKLHFVIIQAKPVISADTA